MKRIILAVLSITMLLSSLQLAVYAQDTQLDVTFERQMLQNLGILTDADLANEEEYVSRADFVYYTAKLIQLPEFPQSEAQYFDDVGHGQDCSELINYFAENGYVSKGGNFEPERTIKGAEAYRILLEILGYADRARLKGGFPSGYVGLADDLEWITVLDGLKANELIQLLFDAANTYYYDISSIRGTDALYSANKDKTILSYYYNIKKLTGFVEAVDGMSLTGNSCSIGYMRIGDTLLSIEEVPTAQDYLGRMCDVYYYDSDVETGKLFMMDINKKDDAIVLDIKYIDKMMDDYTLRYFKSEKAKEIGNYSTLRISQSLAVIKNGERIERDIVDAINNLNNGTVVLNKTSNDKEYTYAVIKDYKDVLVGHFNSSTMILYDGMENKQYNLNNFDKVDVFSQSGVKRTVDSILTGEMVNIATDGSKYIEIICELDKVTGVIANTDDDRLTINDKVYRYSKSWVNQGYNIQIGKEYTLYLNAFGEAAHIEASKVGDMQAAYLLRCREIESELDGRLVVQLKLYDLNGEVTLYELAEKVKIDGVRLDDTGEIAQYFNYGANTLGKPADSLEHQLILYKKNSDGKISTIDTYKEGNQTYENTLVKSSMVDSTPSEPKYRVYYSGLATRRRIGLANMMDTSSQIVTVPLAEQLLAGTYDENSFKMTTYDEIIPDSSYYMECYKIGDASLVENYIIVHDSMELAYNDYNSRLMVVNKTVLGVDEDNVPVTQLVGVMGGSEVKLTLSDTYNTSIAMPDKGDVIAVNLNNRGELNSYFTCYDVSADKVAAVEGSSVVMSKFGLKETYSSNLEDKFQMFYGYAVDSDGIAASLSTAPVKDDPLCVQQVANLSSYGFTLIDNTNGDLTIRNGSMSDLVSYNKTESLTNASRVIIYTRFLGIRDIIVINK